MIPGPLHLPFPPSANALTRNRAGGRANTDRYKTWRRAADNLFLAQRRALGGLVKVEGTYHLLIVLDQARRLKKDGTLRKIDAGNYEKAISDWLVSREIVQDDRLADAVAIVWGEAPEGCKVLLRASASSFVSDIIDATMPAPRVVEAAE